MTTPHFPKPTGCTPWESNSEMNIIPFLKSTLTTLLHAVGQFFAWLNRRDAQKEDNETKTRIAENMQAAAKPNQENANRLNRWLARGRSGRLRDRPK